MADEINENSVDLRVDIELNARKVDDASEYIKSTLGKSVKDGLIKQLKDSQLEIVKVGKKYQAILQTLNKSGKVKDSKLVTQKKLSKSEAQTLLGDNVKSSKDVYNQYLNLEERAEAKRQKQRRKNAEKKKKEDAKIAKEKEKQKKKEEAQLQKIEDDTLKKQWKREWQTDYLMPNMDKQGQLSLKLQMAKEDVEELENEFMTLKMSGAPEEQLEDISNRLGEAQKEVNKLNKASKLGGLEKLWNTFKRVGFYRLFRGIFSAISQGYKEGMDYLIAFDKEANKTMSSLSSSYDQIKASVALSIMPLMEALAPMLQTIANGFMSFSENISIAQSQMKGLSTYTKVNEEYMNDLATEAQGFLASFDKFESLNGKISPFTTGNISELTEEELENAEKTQETLQTILDLLDSLFQAGKSLIENIDWDSVAESLSSIIPVLAKILPGLINGFAKVIDFLSDIGLLTPLLWGVATALLAVKLIGAPLSTGLIIGAVVTGIAWLSSLQKEHGNAISKIGGVVSNNTSATATVPTYNVATGTISNAGTSNSDIKTAMVEALYEAQDVFHQDNSDVVLNVDGAEIARSRRFKSELNRTNAGLNLR